jgi:NADH-quinone oxidoreductase subunit M
MYELLLLPSFLFVYFISPGKQSIQASIYFVIWTQIGSFLVLLAIAYLLNLLGGSSFNVLRNFTFTSMELSGLMFLLFFGFGFKVPIWPFHYWITKTHVEAPTGFSIFLSGFLVKSAIYGFYKYTTSIGGSIDTTFFSIFVIMGIVDASIKMWGQTDLKKLVAYATIQEMGIIYLVFCWGDIIMIYGGILFCITHAFLSSMFFFFVDCVNRRYNTRNIVEINGILHITPNLGVAILLGCILFSGLPGTMKFISELYIFSGLLELAPLSTLIIIFSANFLGIVGFSKVWFNAVFGLTPTKGVHLPKDLSFKEVYILGLCVFGLFLYGFWVPALF